MAPEQSEGARGRRAGDLYSLALVPVRGADGRQPGARRRPAATARRIGRPLPPLARDRPDLPRALAARARHRPRVDARLCAATLGSAVRTLERALRAGLTRRRGLLARRTARGAAPSRTRLTGPAATEAPDARAAVPPRPSAGARSPAPARTRSGPGPRGPGGRRPARDRSRGSRRARGRRARPADAPHAARPAGAFRLPRAVVARMRRSLAAAWQVASRRRALALLLLAAGAAPAAARPASGTRLARPRAGAAARPRGSRAAHIRRWPVRRRAGHGARRSAPSATGG